MAKVLITALGTGRLSSKTSDLADARPSRKYDPATYVIKDGNSDIEYTTTFIAECLIKHFDIERVYIIGTAKSMWEELYYAFSDKDRDDEYYLQLTEMTDGSSHDRHLYERSYLREIEKVLDRKLGSTGSRCYLVDYGLNREELLGNFEVLMQIGGELQSGDQVYIDITHSFRSLSVFQYIMMSFIENLNADIQIEKILYGMLDIVKEMGGKAPIVDLTVVHELNNWIKAIHDLDNYGNGYLVADLLSEQNPDLAANINDLSDRINMNFLKDIRNEKKRRLWKDLKSIDGPGGIAVSVIERFLKMFNKNQSESEFQLNLARWSFKQKRYAAGYITLTEAIITRLCEDRIDNIENWEERQKVKNAYIKRKDDYLYGLGKLLFKVNEIRRLVAHSQGGNDDQYRSAVENCMGYCNAAERGFRQMGRTSR